MPYALGQRSLGFARRVDPVLVGLAADACRRSRVDFGIQREQTRTEAEQREMVRRGVSKTMQSRHLPHPATLHSTALDLTPWIGGKWEFEDWSPYYEIAAAMREAARSADVRIRWGGVWDRCLNDLPAGAAALKGEVAAYVARRKAVAPGRSVFIDGPHFELMED